MDIQMYKENSRFKLRASALIIENNQLLLVKNTHDAMYYTVGGKVNFGESTAETVEREALEETGLAYKVDRLVYVQELFYQASFIEEATHFHELIFHYLMKPLHRQPPTITHKSYTQKAYQEHFYWVPLEEVKNTYTYPRFLGDNLLHLPDQVEHLVTVEDYDL